jgi:predicted ATPase/DNA-binding CsgD family transcriptional regulator
VASGNLPTPLSPLIGREREVGVASTILQRPETRLLTLTGPGGVGKTRLGLQVAADSVAAFPDGVWFVGLAAITDPELVAPTVANTLDVRVASDQTVADSLHAHLREKHLLLLLDNFEHVVEAAPFVTTLLAGCSGLTVLVTSRTRLRVSGEHEFAVVPLQVTQLEQSITGEGVRASDAMRLFAARAQAVKGDFAVGAENAAVVREICARLDGLPLAIELAAAWVKVLTPPALLARLERRLPLLTGGSRDLPERQQTMRDTIAWSHDLLSPQERVLFRRLAPFVGGCTLQAAQDVAAAPGQPDHDILPDLAALVDKSLLQWRDSGSEEARFSMLETVREFALEQLVASGEEDSVRERHAAYFLNAVEQIARAAFAYRFARDLGADVEELDPVVANQLVVQDLDNVRTALDWLVETGQAEAGIRLTTACVPFWESHGHYREARTRLDRALATAGDESAAFRAQALHMACNVCFMMGDLDTVRMHAREALAISETLGDPRGRANALHFLALIEENRGNWRRATELFEATLAVWRRLNEPIAVGTTLAMLAGIAYGQGELDRAIALAEEAHSLLHSVGDLVGAALALWYLGLFAAARGEILEAARRYQSSLAVIVRIDDSEYLFKPLVGLAAVAAHFGHLESSARLLGAADHTLRQTGGRLFPFDLPAYEQAEAAARATLAEEQFAAAYQQADRLTLEDLLAEADAIVTIVEHAAREPRRPGATTPCKLTARECEVLRLVAEGKTDREIAEILFLSRRTVNAHVASIRGQLGVHSRKAAVDRARTLGVLPAPPEASRNT